MSWEKKPDGPAPRGVDGALRHPDGSPDIAAYARIAHRERDAAIVSSMVLAVRFIGRAWAAISARNPSRGMGYKA